MRPDGVTYSARNASRTSSAIARVLARPRRRRPSSAAARATCVGGAEEVRAGHDVGVGLGASPAGPAAHPGRASRRTGTCPPTGAASPGDVEDHVGPRLHARVLPLERRGVGVPLVQHPRHDGRGVAPRGGGARGAEHVRHDERDDAAFALLLEREVAQPRVEESAHVVEEARRRREDLDVARPAEALVALRAVGRHVEEVAAQPPHDVLVQLVRPARSDVSNQPVRSMSLWITTAVDRGRVELARPARHLGVAEAVESELGLPLLEPAARRACSGRSPPPGAAAGCRARRARAPRRDGA